MLLAIYIEPPADVRSVPQNYTVHCTTVKDLMNVQLVLENSVYVQVLKKHLINTNMDDHTFVVSWNGDEVPMKSTNKLLTDSTELRLIGDHDWACMSQMDSPLQTYIRGYI